MPSAHRVLLILVALALASCGAPALPTGPAVTPPSGGGGGAQPQAVDRAQIASGPTAPSASVPVAAPSPEQAEGTVMHARCNVHYEDGVAEWVNYLRGPIIQFNTAIEVLDAKRDEVEFRLVEGGVELHFANDEAKSGHATWDLFTRLFAVEDQAPRLAALSAGDRKRVGAAEVTQGMTRAAVEMSVCPPPPPATASLDASAWIYWTSRVNRRKVVFDNDGYVSRVEQ